VQTSSLRLICAHVDSLVAAATPVIVAISGPVGVGKTTYAHLLCEELSQRGTATKASVVSTDGFLLPNAVLETAGMAEHKGAPDTFDNDALAWFLETIRVDEAIIGLPRYSHESFDVEPSNDIFTVTPVVIIEGVNALQPVIADAVDLTVYIDADLNDILDWYVERFVGLTEHARNTGSGFYQRFVALNEDELRQTARAVYEQINLPNLRDHIGPTQQAADIIVSKAPNHEARAAFTILGERRRRSNE
jgi:type I pantothenate kinase